MNNRTLIILAEQSLNSSLVQQQLASIEDLTVQVCNPDELTKLSWDLVVDLVIVDYQYLEDLTSANALPNFDVLGLSILLHNIPSEGFNETLMSSRSLKGLLFQNASVEHLTDSVKHILNGGLWLPRGFMEKMLHCYRELGVYKSVRYNLLTSRERQILDLLAQGRSNKEIADQLFLAECTIKTHIYKLYKKLDVHCRKEAITLTKSGFNDVS